MEVDNFRNNLNENVIISWVRLTGILKNTRLTQDLIYNEAIVMLIVYRKYRMDGKGVVSFRELAAETKMLKSLVNRSIDSLVEKKLLARTEGSSDRRMTFVRPVLENFDVYMKEHRHTIETVSELIKTIGEEDAEAFVRLAAKIEEKFPDGFTLDPNKLQ